MKTAITLFVLSVIFFLINQEIHSFDKTDTYHCCNMDQNDPRQLPHGTNFSYFCYNGEVIVEVIISYNCCWDEWAANGWKAPTYRPCPNPNFCVGPPPELN